MKDKKETNEEEINTTNLRGADEDDNDKNKGDNDQDINEKIWGTEYDVLINDPEIHVRVHVKLHN